MAQVKIPTLTMNNGREIPVLGYGTWVGFDKNNQVYIEDIPKLTEALSYAIDIGYRHVDTAHLYRVEPEIGQIINKKIQDGVVKREDLFVTTKVWQHNHREADVEKSVRASLRRTNLDYFDMVLIHWPMSISQEGVDEKIDFLETWRGFENVLKKGLTKSIGVSNFNVEQLTRLLANCTVPPACNQIEINLNLGQEELVEFCQSNNIVVVAYSPFGTMVPSRAAPNSPEPKLNHPTMVALSKKYNKTVTQIVLRYLQEGVDEKIDFLETWRGFENVLKKGLTKSIGVSNFNVEQLTRLLANCTVPPACNQIEINLNLGQEELVEFCQSNNIVVVAYSPFGTMVPSRAAPNSPEPKLNHPTMVALSKKYNKTVTQIVLRYLYQRGIVSIPKTVTKTRVLENASIFDFTISEADVATLAAFDNGYRTVPAHFWKDYLYYPFDKSDIKADIPQGLLTWKNGINQDID